MFCLPVMLALLASVVACGGADEPASPDVLLLILDTARADHFGAYGYDRPTTPNFDRFAEEGRRFDSAWAQSPWTLPAVATILTGQPPWVHGAGRARRGIMPLRPEVTSLAELMTVAGYRSAAFMNVVWCSPELSALDRGFEHYDFETSDESNRDQRNAAETTAAALEWLDRIGDDPFFMVLHYFDPHLTYHPPAPYDTMFGDQANGLPPDFGSAAEIYRIRDGSLRLSDAQQRTLMARYDGELRYADEQFGRLREALEERGRWDKALIIVVADHGEEFWDHGGFEHGHSHYRELLRLPLIVKHPGRPAGGEAVADRVTQLDLAPTILDFAGLPIPEEMPGKPFGSGGSPYAIAEGSLWGGELLSARSDSGTLIIRRNSAAMISYAPDDRLEENGMAGERYAPPDLLELLRALPAPPSRNDPPVRLTGDQIERLRSLGYLK
jgi:arylsulfatase A-like enzyme